MAILETDRDDIAFRLGGHHLAAHPGARGQPHPEIEAEAALLAPYRGCERVELTFTG